MDVCRLWSRLLLGKHGSAAREESNKRIRDGRGAGDHAFQVSCDVFGWNIETSVVGSYGVSIAKRGHLAVHFGFRILGDIRHRDANRNVEAANGHIAADLVNIGRIQCADADTVIGLELSALINDGRGGGADVVDRCGTRDSDGGGSARSNHRERILFGSGSDHNVAAGVDLRSRLDLRGGGVGDGGDIGAGSAGDEEAKRAGASEAERQIDVAGRRDINVLRALAHTGIDGGRADGGRGSGSENVDHGGGAEAEGVRDGATDDERIEGIVAGGEDSKRAGHAVCAAIHRGGNCVCFVDDGHRNAQTGAGRVFNIDVDSNRGRAGDRSDVVFAVGIHSEIAVGSDIAGRGRVCAGVRCDHDPGTDDCHIR